MARGISMPALWGSKLLARSLIAFSVRELQPSNNGNCWNDIPRYSPSINGLVAGYVVDDLSERRSQRTWSEASIGMQLQNSMDVAA